MAGMLISGRNLKFIGVNVLLRKQIVKLGNIHCPIDYKIYSYYSYKESIYVERSAIRMIMTKKASIMFMLLVSSLAFGSSVMQSTWTGGPGYMGPMSNWANGFFYVSSGICYWEWQAHNLTLASNIPTWVDNTCDWPFGISSADIDADGDQDLIGAISGGHQGDDDIIWWENLDGYGSEWGRFVIDPYFDGAAGVCSEDIDGNGSMDVVGSAVHASQMAWWSNDDGTGLVWTKHVIDSDYADATRVASADMDGDGDMDVLAASWWRDEVSWWENTDGVGETWTKWIIDYGLLGTREVVPCDVDGDGYMDVMGQAVYDHEVYWWRNTDGSGETWTVNVISSVAGSGPRCLDAGDIDGDGDLDAVVGMWGTREYVWYENLDGVGMLWSSKKLIWDGVDDNCPSDVEVTDLDGDGDADVAIAVSNSGGDLLWCENVSGTGETWDSHYIDEGSNSPTSVSAVDLNQDGVNDLAVVLSAGQMVYWWDLEDEMSSGFLESTILETNSTPDYQTFLWDAETPMGTTVGFQIRASDDYEAMGDWSDILYTCPVATDSVISDGCRYFQYRTILETTYPEITPIVSTVTIQWNTLGIEGSGEVAPLLTSAGNPSPGTATIFVNCAEPLELAISLFDLSGRQVRRIPIREYSPASSIQLDNLQPGVYLCTATGEEIRECLRLVIID